MSISIKDFCPINSWAPDLEGKKYKSYGEDKEEAQFIIDQTTNRRYLNESKGIVGFKCFLLTLGTPFVHSIASIGNIVYRILKLATLSHFLGQKDGETAYNFKARLHDASKDLLRLIATPASLLGLEIASIYGMLRSYDGRKLYASIERATYGNFILAPCFQPEAKYHALGGDIDQKNAF